MIHVTIILILTKYFLMIEF
ncbi:hypothetical protein BDFB_013699 [Asbolus verrucosus]|uniref:Uncharacterized protein n=1 Tax=Asbolus verrucosus TaxID=1661398 RepID=A0A482VWG4_ASBVE|nr:hypothetical protein BDFB_013699 [Asbolus verrucosus]